MKKTMIKKYIRDEKRNPHGVVVCVKQEDGKELFGYSLCNPLDKFDKKLGTAIALARATNPKLKPETYLAPLVINRREAVLKSYGEIALAAEKYFKQ